MIEVKLNATVDGKALWAKPGSLAARSYGVSKCVNVKTCALFTAVRFNKG